MTITDTPQSHGAAGPTNGHRPDPTSGRPADWAALRGRAREMTRWTDVAISLANEAAAAPPPGRLARWRGRRAAARAERPGPALAAGRVVGSDRPAVPATSRLRYIPPAAALGTAFVLQVIAMTDVVGGSLAESIGRSDIPALAGRPELGYLAAMLLGIAVASCAEGGAAYLMDLYDKHLMARDSVWVLRLAMFGYVAASAGVIHWWLDTRELPSIVSWVLAGMSASALFLWSRGSRWRNRTAMRDAGQLDPAMPRMSTAAKLLHPVRWVITLYLVSWEPVATTEEARARYDQWSAGRVAKRRGKAAARNARPARADRRGEKGTAVPAEPAAAPEREPGSADDPGACAGRPDPAEYETDRTDPTTQPAGQERADHGPTALTDAAFLRETYGHDPADLPGRNELHRRHGGHKERWTKALKAYTDRAGLPPSAKEIS